MNPIVELAVTIAAVLFLLWLAAAVIMGVVAMVMSMWPQGPSQWQIEERRKRQEERDQRRLASSDATKALISAVVRRATSTFRGKGR